MKKPLDLVGSQLSLFPRMVTFRGTSFSESVSLNAVQELVGGCTKVISKSFLDRSVGFTVLLPGQVA